MAYQDQDIPIESRDGVVSETIDRSDDVIEDLVVWCNPGHPVEGRQSKEDVVGELYISPMPIRLRKEWTYPEVNEHRGKGYKEALHPRRPEDFPERTKDWGLVITDVQRFVEGDGDERSGPDGVCGIDEESSNDTCHTVSDKVGTKCNEDLVCETSSIALIV